MRHIFKTRSIIVSILCLLLWTATVSPGRSYHQQQQAVVIRGGWLFDAVQDDVVRNAAILVRGGKFIEVGRDVSARDLSGARVIELSDDDYILPGLFDLHAHYAVDFFGRGRVDEYAVYPVIFLANGVTTTFPAGEWTPDSMRAARERINRGEQIGPRILNSGRYFGRSREGWNDSATALDIYDEVDYWIAQGVRGFKAKGISPLHLRALIERAHMHGVTVTGHLGSGFRNSVNPKDAILMGIDRVEHFLGGDALPPDRSAYASLVHFSPNTPEFDDIVALYLTHNVYFDATLSAYGYYGDRDEVYEYWVEEQKFLTPFLRQYLEEHRRRPYIAQFDTIYHVKRKTIKAFYDAGGGHLITLGTDHPSTGEYISGFSVHRELHAFVLSGIPPAAVLRFATINAAHALNLSDKLGTIESGKFADLFVVRGNPLEDIRNTRNVRLVMKAGQVFDSQELLKSVEGRMGPASPDEVDRWGTRPRASN